MATASAAVEAISFDDFIEDYTGQHVCLIEGVVFPMSPVGREHIGCVMFLADWLRSLQLDSPHHVREEKPLFTLGSDPEPDIAVMPGTRESARHTRAEAQDALLLVEVAESSLRFDRQKKLPLYARAGVADVWIVDVAGRRIEVNRQPDLQSRTYSERAILRGDDSLCPGFASGAQVQVRMVFGDS